MALHGAAHLPSLAIGTICKGMCVEQLKGMVAGISSRRRSLTNMLHTPLLKRFSNLTVAT